MLTIKFVSRTEDSMIKEYNRDVPRCAVQTALYEGVEPWHREYTVQNVDEWEKWRERFLSGSQCYFPGGLPKESFVNVPKGEDPGIVYFQYLTFKDAAGEFHRAVVFQADCYIMNESGQTVDRFSA